MRTCGAARRIADRRQIQEPDPVREQHHHFGGKLQRQPGLAQPADAKQPTSRSADLPAAWALPIIESPIEGAL